MIVLTVDPLLFGFSLPIMSWVCKGYAVTNGHTRVRVPTSTMLTRRSISDGAEAVNDALHACDEDLEILAYSMGAQMVGEWMRRYGQNPPANLKRIILIGNPERRGAKGGRYIDGSPLKPTPQTLPSKCWTLPDGDFFADPQGLPTLKAKGIHSNYFSVDLDNLNPVETVGNTTFVVTD